MSRWPTSADQPRIVAHRGDSHHEPEHTLAAYHRAIEQGADALECDVRLTADGHLVCLHDRLIDRTSNGQGPVSVAELPLLRELDFGSWKTSGATDADPKRERTDVLTLRQLLTVVADSDRPIELAVETKHPNRYAGLVERRLVETLDEFGWANPVTTDPAPVRVMSFSPLALRRMRALAPQVPRVVLMKRIPPSSGDGSLPRGVSIAGLNIGLVRSRPDYVARVRDRGGQVHVWTVDTEEDVRRCLDVGAQAIITNRPGPVRSIVEGIRDRDGRDLSAGHGGRS
jgi:glycerophosphoryl diester phosphodiesterase